MFSGCSFSLCEKNENKSSWILMDDPSLALANTTKKEKKKGGEIKLK
jgi:hypothetical protein